VSFLQSYDFPGYFIMALFVLFGNLDLL